MSFIVTIFEILNVSLQILRLLYFKYYDFAQIDVCQFEKIIIFEVKRLTKTCL